MVEFCKDLKHQVLRSRISALLLGPFEMSIHRRTMHSPVRRDLVEPITMLLVWLKDSSSSIPFKILTSAA